jgi:hypothetical protein
MMSRRIRTAFVVILAMGALLVAAVPGQAQVSVNIGINVPAPPRLVAIPQSPIRYAPRVDANYFFYDGEYWVFRNGAWYAGPRYNGPWAAVAPEFVPPPLLGVPVRYYRRPPPEWRQWRAQAPPRWESHWGHRWQERRYEGQASPRHDRRDDRGRDRYDEGRHEGRR